VHTRAGASISAVVGDEDADVVAFARAGDERRLHVHDRRVTDERARIDDPTGPHLKRRNRDVVRGAVVDPTRQIVDAGLREAWDRRNDQQSEC
jgi:hypothetical protein